MQRKDGQRRALGFSTPRSPAFSRWARPLAETESFAADVPAGDLAEGASPSWESDWIDIGGEG